MNKTDFPDGLLQVLRQGPNIHASVFVAPGAQVIGDVRVGEGASIWYNAVVRGDINYIAIGSRTNIQDGSVLHVENARPCVIGNDITVGHNANLHACVVEDGCLIGIGAIVLSGAIVKKGCIIAAGAVVLEETVVEEFSLMAGVPAKKIKSLPPSVWETHLQWAAKYARLAQVYKNMAGRS